MTANSATDRTAGTSSLTTVTLLLCASMPMMAFAPLSPALPAIEAEFADVPNIDYLARMMFTLPAIAIAFVAPFVGMLIDRFGRKKLLLAGIAIYGVVGLSGLILGSLSLLILSRLVTGLAIAAIMTASTALAGDLFSGVSRQRFMGMRGAFVNYLAVIMNVAGGLLVAFGWRWVFLVFLIAILALPLAAFIVREPSRESAMRKMEGGQAIAADAAPWLFLVVAYAMTVIYNAAFFAVPVQVPFLLRELGATSSITAGFASATSALFVANTSILYVRSRRRFNAEQVMIIAFGAVAAGFIVIAMASTVPVVFIGVAISGSGFGLLMANTFTWIFDNTPPAIRGRVAGGLATFQFLGQFASPLASQWIASRGGLSLSFIVFATVMGLVALAFAAWVWRSGAARPGGDGVSR